MSRRWGRDARVPGRRSGARPGRAADGDRLAAGLRSEEHTSELQSRQYLPSFPTRRSADLVGMPERVMLPGGTLRAGPRPEGGFEVCARLPVEARDVAEVGA